ncbi:uncharacterized protein Tco025E_09685, partial [Trypanosoma conorhini]
GDNGGPLSFFCARQRRVGGADVRHPRGCVLKFPQRCFRKFISRLAVCVRGAGAPKKNKVKAQAHAPRRSGPAMTLQMRRSTPSVARVGPVSSALRRRDGEAVNTPATRLADVFSAHSRSSAELCSVAWHFARQPRASEPPPHFILHGRVPGAKTSERRSQTALRALRSRPPIECRGGHAPSTPPAACIPCVSPPDRHRRPIHPVATCQGRRALAASRGSAAMEPAKITYARATYPPSGGGLSVSGRKAKKSLGVLP